MTIDVFVPPLLDEVHALTSGVQDVFSLQDPRPELWGQSFLLELFALKQQQVVHVFTPQSPP